MTHPIHPAFHVTEEAVDGEPVLSVAAPDDETSVAIALRGATLLTWRVSKTRDLTDGYRSHAELTAQDGVRNGILAPFPNRVADGRYSFAGSEYDLLPGPRGERTIYHGFARTAQFTLAEATTTADEARLVLRTEEIRPDRHPGYPFALDIEVEYTIATHRLDLEIRATNAGDRAAPYAAGWHPYFRLGNGIDDLTLEIPADTVIQTDKALIPLAGPAAYAELDHRPDLDFRKPRPLAGRIIDTCFTDLRPDEDGSATTVLRDPETGEELHIRQTSGLMHVFTGDTLARGRRASIALEPVETMTDAFNRPDCAASLPLEPGRTRRFRCAATHVPALR